MFDNMFNWPDQDIEKAAIAQALMEEKRLQKIKDLNLRRSKFGFSEEPPVLSTQVKTADGALALLKVCGFKTAESFVKAYQNRQSAGATLNSVAPECYEHGTVDTERETGVPFALLEWVEGVEYQFPTAQPAPNASARIGFEFAKDTLAALTVLGATGLVHNDIKPDNVIKTQSGARLIDLDNLSQAGAPRPGIYNIFSGPEILFTTPGDLRGDLYNVGYAGLRYVGGDAAFKELGLHNADARRTILERVGFNFDSEHEALINEKFTDKLPEEVQASARALVRLATAVLQSDPGRRVNAETALEILLAKENIRQI